MATMARCRPEPAHRHPLGPAAARRVDPAARRGADRCPRGLSPIPQEIRAKKIGHLIVNSAMDRPWSQYFCCVAIGNREFVQKHPIATKRALRAILGADLCASEPDRAARIISEKRFATNYDYALQAMQEIYNRWREYDPEDAVRFALRLQEAGFIKSTPQKIIAQGTAWRFFNELRKELKG